MLTENYIKGGTQKTSYAKEEVCFWPCPLCGAEKTKTLKTERGILGIDECKNCSLIRVNPRLKSPEEIYQGNADIYREEFRLVVNGKAPHHRDPNYLADLKLIEKFQPSGNFLDIGTNTGSFLRLARNRGWKLLGVEPSAQLANLAREWWGLEIVEGFIEKLKLPAHHYDVVTMTDVFEHVVNPKDVLTAVHRILSPTGILFIKVPNGNFNIFKYKMRKLLGKNTENDFDAYEHVLHYTERTLNRMLESCGFEPVFFTAEPPVQLPVWHKYVDHYYHHASPFFMDWKTYAARNVLFRLSHVENLVRREIGYLTPNIGVIARPKPN